eukprot:271783-Pleurochrysis_carterae.AAC.1
MAYERHVFAIKQGCDKLGNEKRAQFMEGSSGVLLEDLVALAMLIVMDGVGDVMAMTAVSAVVVVLDTRIINQDH